MTLQVYNTLSRQVEDFKPIKEGELRVYICGLTVYDFMHIGHARTYIAFDTILRYLKYRGFSVKYVQNVTDIDDKIIKRAGERSVNPLDLSKEFTEKSLEDQGKLGLLSADAYPKVSENIPEIIEAVGTLVHKDNAYVTSSGVYFDVSTASRYGSLSHQDTEQLNLHRIEPDPEKRNPLDFALWKKSSPGELGFESPWGFGRPGWHIECSVMSRKHLGEQLDIHGGALDLIFPHHENEIAQSEALSRKRFVKYWMHTGFLYSSGKKMSKSLGNIISVRGFLGGHSKDALRLFVLQTHYRSPVDYSKENIANAEKAVLRLRNFKKEFDAALSKAGGSGSRAGKVAENLRAEFISNMDSDFNTPKALAALFDAVREANLIISEDSESKDSLLGFANAFDEITGILGLDLKSNLIILSEEEKKIVDERAKYREEKSWAAADRLRNQLLARGIRLVDKKDGTTAIERLG